MACWKAACTPCLERRSADREGARTYFATLGSTGSVAAATDAVCPLCLGTLQRFDEAAVQAACDSCPGSVAAADGDAAPTGALVVPLPVSLLLRDRACAGAAVSLADALAWAYAPALERGLRVARLRLPGEPADRDAPAPAFEVALHFAHRQADVADFGTAGLLLPLNQRHPLDNALRTGDDAPPPKRARAAAAAPGADAARPCAPPGDVYGALKRLDADQQAQLEAWLERKTKFVFGPAAMSLELRRLEPVDEYFWARYLKCVCVVCPRRCLLLLLLLRATPAPTTPDPPMYHCRRRHHRHLLRPPTPAPPRPRAQVLARRPAECLVH